MLEQRREQPAGPWSGRVDGRVHRLGLLDAGDGAVLVGQGVEAAHFLWTPSKERARFGRAAPDDDRQEVRQGA